MLQPMVLARIHTDIPASRLRNAAYCTIPTMRPGNMPRLATDSTASTPKNERIENIDRTWMYMICAP